MSDKDEISIRFRVDGKYCASRQWRAVPRVGEIVYLNDYKRPPENQYPAEVKQVRYYDSEEIRSRGWVRVDIDVEWVELQPFVLENTHLQRAREILAEEYDRAGSPKTAQAYRNGKYDDTKTIKAVMRALQEKSNG